MTALRITTLLQSGAGFTISRFGTGPAKRYVVSPYKHAERIFRFGITTTEVRNWLRANSRLIQREGHYIGGWRHGGDDYLDICVETDSEATAREICRKNQQSAFYDTLTGDSIYVR